MVVKILFFHRTGPLMDSESKFVTIGGSLDIKYSIITPFLLHKKASRLQLLHGSNVGGLDVVLILLDLGLELVGGDLLVLDNQVDLELLNTETNSNELRGTPDETVHLNGADVGLHLAKVGLIICSREVSTENFIIINERELTYPRASPPG